MKVEIKSIFEQISEQIFKMTDLQQAKAFIDNFVKEKNINDVDKQSIIKNVSECKSLIRLQTYICNSLLKFEGLSVNS